MRAEISPVCSDNGHFIVNTQNMPTRRVSVALVGMSDWAEVDG